MTWQFHVKMYKMFDLIFFKTSFSLKKKKKNSKIVYENRNINSLNYDKKKTI